MSLYDHKIIINNKLVRIIACYLCVLGATLQTETAITDRQWPSVANVLLNQNSGKKKTYTTTTERKSSGQLVLWPQKRTSQTNGGYKKSSKNPGSHIYHTNFFPLWPPFLSAKRSSSLEQGGVWFLFSQKPARLRIVAPCGWEFNLGRGRGWESQPLSRFCFALV